MKQQLQLLLQQRHRPCLHCWCGDDGDCVTHEDAHVNVVPVLTTEFRLVVTAVLEYRTKEVVSTIVVSDFVIVRSHRLVFVVVVVLMTKGGGGHCC